MVSRRFESMSALLLTVIGISMGIPHCPMWKDIMPCTCRMGAGQSTYIYCDQMNSFEQVVNLFRGHFSQNDKIMLRISYSALEDLPFRRFQELNMSIENLQLNHNDIRYVRPETFEGLASVSYFSLADNSLTRVPEEIWQNMPYIKTVDLGRTRIQSLSETSFRGLVRLQVLVIPGNYISQMDANCLPVYLHRLHLGRNRISTLNSTLLNFTDLFWLFLNSNNLKTLENQLPLNAPNLTTLHVAQNLLEKIPEHVKTYSSLESLFAYDNFISSLNGIFSRARKLKRLQLENNTLDTIRQDEFLECELLEVLILNHNRITALNGSLVNLRNLNSLNVSHNFLHEFSFQEIIGLQKLQIIDLSFNRISKIIGSTALSLSQNSVDWNIKLTEIKLEHNELESLNGALSGLPDLLRLHLSYNKLKHISPDDLIGLDQLRLLDISYNQIKTLEKTSETFLPRLEELRASHNYLTILERDFHGLPVLCYADLSSNKIVALGRELVTKTRCKIGHGVHEGTWDTLKIDLQDNPILCDAALPEITSAMEVNHTRIFGVSHCPPLSEQPTTSKPNRFLGYVPEMTSSSPAAISGEILEYQREVQSESPENQVQINPFVFQPLPITSKRELGLNSNKRTDELVQTNTERLQNDQFVTEIDAQNASKSYEELNATLDQMPKDEPLKRLVEVELRLASEIENLKTQLKELTSQNQLLAKSLQQETQPQTTTEKSVTERLPNDDR